jgi:hypothetical protein
MIINRNNYKTYFLDFWEASLEEKDKTALLLFLEKNPDLQNEFLDFKAALDITIPRVTHLEFPNKKDLKKVEIQSVGEINQMNWENWVIAHLEGELTFEQEQAYQNFVKANPQVETEIDLYRKAYLKLDKSIVFPYKSELKRRQIPILSFGRVKAWQAVAAVLAIAFALYQIVDFSALSESENPIVVQNDTPSSLNTTRHRPCIWCIIFYQVILPLEFGDTTPKAVLSEIIFGSSRNLTCHILYHTSFSSILGYFILLQKIAISRQAHCY